MFAVIMLPAWLKDMNALGIAGLVAAALTTLLLLLLFASSVRERVRRAWVIALALVIVSIAGWGVIIFVLADPRVLAVADLAFGVFLILFFAPIGRITRIEIQGDQERYDERENIFARDEDDGPAERYAEFYKSHPELRRWDDRIRSLPRLGEEGSRFYHRLNSIFMESEFDLLEELTPLVGEKPSGPRREVDPSGMSGRLKRLALYLGADLAGIAALNPAYVYTHVGRGPEPFGAEIQTEHRYALCFALEMDYEMVSSSPLVPTTIETGRQYLRAALISFSIERYLRSLGFSARSHIAGSNYQVIAPAVAADAGLGELGRMGILISKKFGARMRLGVVTTEMPLVPDGPVAFGVQDFCESCLKCARCCPAQAIPSGPKRNVRGVLKWQISPEKCYNYWRTIGTDCATCMYVCPYSKPGGAIHSLVRSAIERSAVARSLSIAMDDFFYGKKPAGARVPSWLREAGS